MSVPAFRECRACGSRNKVKWEYCARCGESLADAPTLSGPSAETRSGEPVDIGGGPQVNVLAIVALAAVAVTSYAYFQTRDKPKAAPTADFFVLPTNPVGSPRPVPQAGPPGDDNFRMGSALYVKGQAAAALPYLAAAVAAASDNALYHDVYGKALSQTGGRTEALVQIEAAIHLSPSSADYHLDRARALLALERREDAAKEYALLVELSPGHADGLQALARLKGEQGASAEVVKLLERASAVRPGDIVLAQELGYALEKAGNLEGAQTYYSRVLERQPDAQLTRSRLAETLVQQQRMDDAIDLLRAGIGRTPTAPLLQRSLGSVLERSGKDEEAIAAYREYVRLAPNAEDAKGLEARAASLERRLAGAREARSNP